MIPGPWRDRLRLAALAVVALVLAHDLVFLLTDGSGGYGVALAQTGHGTQWTATVVVVAALAISLTIFGTARLISLTHEARELEGHGASVRSGRTTDLAGHLVQAWLVILPVSLALFVLVENLEHLSAGLPAPGLAVLGSVEYHGVLGVFALVSLLAALVEALYRWRRDVLIARIQAARARLARRPARVARRALPWVDLRHAAIIGHRISGRAPPQLSA
jgi:hypothetical protein